MSSPLLRRFGRIFTSSTQPKTGRRPSVRRRPQLEALEDRLAPAVIMVTTAVDNGNNAAPTPGSLRAAIIASNASVGVRDTIQFQAGMTIFPPIALPAITDPVTIDGYAGGPGGAKANTNPLGSGDNAVIGVELDGVTNARDGLTINAPGTIVQGLALVRFWHAFVLNSNGNTIAGNFIGIDATKRAFGNDTGVDVLSANNTIGGAAAAAANVISGSVTSGALLGGDGVALDGTAAFANMIEQNLIGTDVSGTVAMANQANGVIVQRGAHNNIIGGAALGEGNIISGNTQNGIEILSDISMSLRSDNNQILGNLIGTKATGLAALPNGNGLGGPSDPKFDGIFIKDANFTVIGDVPPNAGNVISGNAQNGIHVENSTGNDAIMTSVENNIIGLNNVANAKVANGASGVYLDDAGQSFIGDRKANVISGNTADGVFIYNVNAISDVVEGNLIGTDGTGKVGLGNGTGVAIGGGASGNHIGGSGAPYRNIISANGNGVDIYVSSGNYVQGNYIGTDITGAAALANTLNGALLEDGATSNTIGGQRNTNNGTLGPLGNVISANGANGISITSASHTSTGNLILGNFIGTDLNGNGLIQGGKNVLGNASDGIYIALGSDGNTIGGTVPSSGNLISGNGNYGLEIASKNNFYDYNIIGYLLDGKTLLPNLKGVWSIAANNTDGGHNVTPVGP
jgi:hypothetical protein